MRFKIMLKFSLLLILVLFSFVLFLSIKVPKKGILSYIYIIFCIIAIILSIKGLTLKDSELNNIFYNNYYINDLRQ